MDAAARIARLAGTGVREVRQVGGQHLWRHYSAILADGRQVFVKLSERSLGRYMLSEAAGLQWLAAAGGPGIPDVLGCDEHALVLSWVAQGPATPEAAERFGRELAVLHAAGADGFGAPWPGFIASLPLDNEPERPGGWPEWYASRRLLPYLRRA